VINYDIPDTADAYTHRIWRTGRAAKEGDAFTLVTREDVEMVRIIERVLGSVIERRKLDDFDYSIAAPRRDAEFDRPPREPQRRGHSDGRQAPKRATAAPAIHRGADGRPAARPQATGATQTRSFRPRGQR
jgi:ATP-dependent RNA helicase RhlE